MVSNDRSRSSGSSRRSASRWSEALSSSTLALRRLFLDPAEEAGDGRAVARLRGLLAGDLDRILDRLGQDRSGRAPATILAPALSSASKIAATARSGSTATVLPSSSAERRLERIALVQPDAIAEMLAHLGVDLLRIDEQVGGAVGMDQRIGQRDRRARRRPAPRTLNAQAIESSADSTAASAPCLASQSAISCALFGRRPARIFVGLDDQLRLRRFRAGPPRPCRSGCARPATSSAPRLASASRRLLHPVAAVQPRVVADPRRPAAHAPSASRRCWSPAPTGSSSPCRRPGCGPAACSGRRRRSPLPRGSTTAEPAEPSNPVSQASRWA